MKYTLPRTRRSLRAALLPALLLACLPAAARAATVTVDCTAVAPPPGIFTSINAALFTLDNIGPHTINVTGPCTESVNIIMRDRLTIQAPVGQTATINAPVGAGSVFFIAGAQNILLTRLVIRGASGNGVVITRASHAQLTGVHIKENAANGLRVDTGSVVLLGGPVPAAFVTTSDNGGAGVSSDASVLSVGGFLTSENNEGFGLTVTGGRLTVNGTQGENVIRDNGSGINLDATVANFNGQNTIQNNDLTGVQVGSGRVAFSAAVVSGVTRATTIEGHTLGLNVAGAGSVNFGGANRIRHNGGGNPDAQFRGGIRIGTVSRVQIDGPTEVTDNTGYGILLDFNGALADNGAVVTNNTEGGVRVTRSSVGNFDLGSIFSGNGGAQISCDDTSLVSGPGLAGLANKDVACKNIEHAQGPPRPSVPREQDE